MSSLINAYVTLVCVLAAAAAATQDWSSLPAIAVAHAGGLSVLLALGLLSESLIVKFSGNREGGTHTITFIPLFAAVLLFGPTVGAIYLGLTSAITELLILRKGIIRAIFNVSQYVLATCVAGWVYFALGAGPLVGAPAGAVEPFVFGRAFLGFALTLFIVNHAAVSVAVSLSQQVPLRQVWARSVGKSGAGIFYDLLVSPIAVAVAILYLQVAEFGLIVAILPLLFIRHAYLTNYRLTQANTDLLTALVKAIETRDPYTSGHSQRVSALATRICESMHLSERTTEDICTAALLHDVGKIESAFSEILRKPSDLTPHEREVIQSHVLKGVELLESLSSFGPAVISAVRHHHERVDGRGYPDGLHLNQISLGGRIIKICDAIDAMLSDRPYRKALTVREVKEQLIVYSGSQFDSGIVQVVVRSDLLDRHSAEINGFVPPESARPHSQKSPERISGRPLEPVTT